MDQPIGVPRTRSPFGDSKQSLGNGGEQRGTGQAHLIAMKSIYASHRPVVNAYLVRQRDRRRLRELLLVLALALPLAGSVLCYTWIHLQVLGAGYQLPVIYAGNKDAAPVIRETLGERTALSVVPNLRPTMERLGIKTNVLQEGNYVMGGLLPGAEPVKCGVSIA